jgi:hypothetical protein
MCVYQAVCNWSKNRHHIQVTLMSQLTVFGEMLWNILLENLSIRIFIQNIITTIITKHSALRQIHHLFQNEFSRPCDQVLHLSNFCIVCFLEVIQYLFTSSSSSFRPFYVFSLVICFRRQFLLKMWPIQLAFLRCIVHVPSLTLSNTSLFLHPRSNWFFVPSTFFKPFTVCMT